MRWLLKLSRLAFICNLFFLVAFSLQLSNWIKNEEITSTVVVLGYLLGFLVNPVTNICYLFTAVLSRRRLAVVPSWLMVGNILFLVIDGFYLLYINSHQ